MDPKEFNAHEATLRAQHGVPSWVMRGDVSDYLARKQGYQSEHQMKFSRAIQAHQAGDSSLLDEFEATDPILQSRKRGSLRYTGK